MDKNIFRAARLLPLVLLVGCSAMQQARNEKMDQVLVAGDYRAAALIAEDQMGFVPDGAGKLPPVIFQSRNVLNHLDAGRCWMLAEDPDRSIAQFDAAEESLKGIETAGALESGTKMVGASLISESLNDYVPSPAEAVLVNYYKALAFLMKGDTAGARVELNRSDDRTRRAVERYTREIEEARAKGEGGASYADPAVRSGIEAKFPDMAQWTPYKEFIVPPAAYLQALFLGRSADVADRQRAGTLYGRIVGIVDANAAVTADAGEVGKGRICPADNCAWILVEQGLGPDLEESRFDLPLPLPSGTVVASMALPRFHSRLGPDAPVEMRLDQTPVAVPLMGSMDRVVQSEFQKRFPGIATRAVIASSAKAVAQDQANKANPYLGLAANVMTLASTGADVRSWRSMPGRWYLARVPVTGGQTLVVPATSGPVEVKLPASGSQFVYVRSLGPTARPVVNVFGI